MNQQDQPLDQFAGSDLADQIADSQEIVEVKRYIATVTLTLPNIRASLNRRARSGAVILAKQAITNEMVSQEWIDERVAQGYLFEEKTQAPTFKQVRESLDVVEMNASAVVKGGIEDNPLDAGIDLVATGNDPALESRLDDIAAEQEEQGIETDGSELEPDAVEINAETGVVTRTGGEIEFGDDEDEEQADSQVS